MKAQSLNLFPFYKFYTAEILLTLELFTYDDERVSPCVPPIARSYSSLKSSHRTNGLALTYWMSLKAGYAIQCLNT
jgi:hypothetical protein